MKDPNTQSIVGLIMDHGKQQGDLIAAQTRIRALEAEVAALARDKERIDWIDAQEQLAIRKGKYCSGTVRIYREDAALAHGLSVRGALDAAIQAEKGEAPS